MKQSKMSINYVLESAVSLWGITVSRNRMPRLVHLYPACMYATLPNSINTINQTKSSLVICVAAPAPLHKL